MPTSTGFMFSIVVGVLLLSSAWPPQAPATQDSTDSVHRSARHFPERPPVQLEILHTADQQPRMVVTNHHQYSLTAFVVRTDPTAANTITNTLMFDGLTHIGLLAPIPRGLSFVAGVPHLVGQSPPDPVLAAAVWEDGSTYGPDELLARIPKARSALADSYDRAIAMLQTGVDKNWTAAEYSAAAQQMRLQRDTTRETAVPEASLAETTPIHTITINMERMARQERSAKIVASMARSLVARFTEDRDALRQALTASNASAEGPSDR